MASLERTAYPRFARILTSNDLLRLYTPLPEEIEWASSLARKDRSRLGLLTLLKCFQQLHYFPSIDSIPEEIVRHIRAVMELDGDIPLDYRGAVTLYRHHSAIRSFLGITPCPPSPVAGIFHLIFRWFVNVRPGIRCVARRVL